MYSPLNYVYSSLNYVYSPLNYVYSPLNYVYILLNYVYSPLNYVYSLLNYVYSPLNYVYSLLKYNIFNDDWWSALDYINFSVKPNFLFSKRFLEYRFHIFIIFTWREIKKIIFFNPIPAGGVLVWGCWNFLTFPK